VLPALRRNAVVVEGGTLEYSARTRSRGGVVEIQQFVVDGAIAEAGCRPELDVRNPGIPFGDVQSRVIRNCRSADDIDARDEKRGCRSRRDRRPGEGHGTSRGASPLRAGGGVDGQSPGPIESRGEDFLEWETVPAET